MPPVRVSRSVCTGVIRSLERAASDAGLAPQQFAIRADLDLASFRSPSSRVLVEPYERALATVFALPNGVPPLCRVGLGWIEDEHPILAARWLNAPRLGEALRAMVLYWPLVSECDRLMLYESGTFGIVACDVAEAGQDAGFRAASYLDMVVGVARAYCGDRPAEFALGLQGPPLSKRARSALEERVGGPVHFRCVTSALRLPRALLTARCARYNPMVAAAFTSSLDAAMRDLTEHASLASRVERILYAPRPLGRQGTPPSRALRRIRAAVGVNDWTLRRQLALEGTSLRKLLLSHRLREAQRLLSLTSLPMRQICTRLGFRTQASFTRFFRSRTGISPDALRQRSTEGRAVRPPPSGDSDAKIPA
jgi:AraC-like DNA-binding protein